MANILVYTENSGGKLSRSALECISYARKIADKSGGKVLAFSAGTSESDGGAGGAGADRYISDVALPGYDSEAIISALAALVRSEQVELVVFAHDHSGKLVAPGLAARLGAGMASGVTSFPEEGAAFVVQRNVFSGKASAKVQLNTPLKVLSLLPNSFPVQTTGSSVNPERVNMAAPSGKIKLRELKISEAGGHVPLPEAEIVVSGGRGLKGPENWGILEDLATALGAATACSRPVADSGWRPHHEHVGQTGVAIRPNLYFAIGISGAIQHLAGVNGSKTIVVINKDPEAPFFKAADYGIVGDAFEVLPKLTLAVQSLKQQ